MIYPTAQSCYFWKKNGLIQLLKSSVGELSSHIWNIKKYIKSYTNKRHYNWGKSINYAKIVFYTEFSKRINIKLVPFISFLDSLKFEP